MVELKQAVKYVNKKFVVINARHHQDHRFANANIRVLKTTKIFLRLLFKTLCSNSISIPTILKFKEILDMIKFKLKKYVKLKHEII